jgi:adenylate cyclase
MAIEIERKFLVNKDKWNELQKPEGLLVRQGYLLTEPEKTIRVRIVGHQGYIAIKGKTKGTKRSEFEYEIPLQDAKELFQNFSIVTISKIRYEIVHHNKCWEVDEFLDENAGLITAEIELENEGELFDLPDWIDKEVTSDVRYYNSNLSVNPFTHWQKDQQ